MVSEVVLRVATHQGEPVPRPDEIMLESLLSECTEPGGAKGAAKAAIVGGRGRGKVVTLLNSSQIFLT